jgi:hypothetical protein
MENLGFAKVITRTHQSFFFIVFVFELRAEWPNFNDVLRRYDDEDDEDDEDPSGMDMDDVASLNGVPLKNSFKCSMIFLLMMQSISCSIGSFGA